MPPRPARPTYTLGERWVRAHGASELIRILDDAYVFATSEGREIDLSKDLVPSQVGRRPTGVDWDFYPPPRLSWPLEVGTRGEGRGMWTVRVVQTAPRFGPSQRTVSRSFPVLKTVSATYHWTVDAYERVWVPAGNFGAFRISFAIIPEDRSVPGWQLRAWYAPKARRWVRAEIAEAPLRLGHRGARRTESGAFEILVVDRPGSGGAPQTSRSPR